LNGSREELLEKLVERIGKVIDNAINRIRHDTEAAQDSPEEGDPFLACLLSDQRFHRATRLERSLRSSLGSAGYEQLALIIAEHSGAKAERGATLPLTVSKEQDEEITKILEVQYNKKNPPDWQSELDRLRCADRNCQNRDSRQITVDLKVCRSGRVQLFFMKTVKPNLDQLRESKRHMLLVWAHQFCTAAWDHLETFFALPYNPFGEGREYKWSFAWQYFRMDSTPVLLGKTFWETIGGKGTYELLIEAFTKAGTSRRRSLEEALYR
jgi:hypothetical protein